MVVFYIGYERDIHFLIIFGPLEQVWLFQLALRFILHNEDDVDDDFCIGHIAVVLNTGSLQHSSDSTWI